MYDVQVPVGTTFSTLAVLGSEYDHDVPRKLRVEIGEGVCVCVCVCVSVCVCVIYMCVCLMCACVGVYVCLELCAYCGKFILCDV